MESNGTGVSASRKESRRAVYSRPVPLRSAEESIGRQNSPIIDVSECGGCFHVYADFTVTNDLLGSAEATVEFARQGVVITRGSIQRYIPIPTDGEIDRAKVTNTGGIVRISVPTAGLGHRWRSIIMW